MTDIGETIAFGTDTPWECPFPHRPKKHTEENYIPPPNTRNDSEKLSHNLK